MKWYFYGLNGYSIFHSIGRGVAGKTEVFSTLKRNDKVYTVVVVYTKLNTLMPGITNNIKPDSFVYIDSYRALDVSDSNI